MMKRIVRYTLLTKDEQKNLDREMKILAMKQEIDDTRQEIDNIMDRSPKQSSSNMSKKSGS